MSAHNTGHLEQNQTTTKDRTHTNNRLPVSVCKQVFMLTYFQHMTILYFRCFGLIMANLFMSFIHKPAACFTFSSLICQRCSWMLDSIKNSFILFNNLDLIIDKKLHLIQNMERTCPSKSNRINDSLQLEMMEIDLTFGTRVVKQYLYTFFSQFCRKKS